MNTAHADQVSAGRDTLHAVTAAAMDAFAVPPRAHAATAYLRQRGIDPAGLDPCWLIGYAPPGWTRLIDTLRPEFPDQALLDAGVARRSSRGSLIDTFRDRVTFGIRDNAGTLAGFIARDLSGDPNAPKYLNTASNPIFDKRRLLYGLHEGHAAGGRQPVIVEGPLDVLAIASRPHHDLLPIAACGTAFTATHARAVAEIAFEHQSPVVIAMDGDTPGRTAALAAGEQLRKLGIDVRIAQLPTGTDPADYLARANPTLDAFHADHALPAFAVQVQHAIAAQGDRMQWIEGRLAALRTIVGHLASYPSSYAARQIAWLSDALELGPSTVADELVGAYRRRGQPRGRTLACAGRDVRRCDPATSSTPNLLER